jgi:hypothetical protein
MSSETPPQAEFLSELERLRFELLESKIPVTFRRDFSGFSFEGVSVPAVSKGSQLEVPYFMAEVLLDDAVIEEFNLDFPDSLQELTGVVRNEVRSGQLQDLPRFFNLFVKDQVLNDQDSDSDYGEVEYKRKRAKYLQLLQARVTKIVKMADGTQRIPRKPNMTAVEQVLFNKLREMVDAYKQLLTENE